MIRRFLGLFSRPKRGDLWTCSCGTQNEPFRTECINPQCSKKNAKFAGRCAF
jgi:hypothetical protein